ncbi:MAG: hypothetical protein M3133_10215, partial [Actinomycetota bacterium]|nr:hypothetical protein [Actinomycetota bacterium]
LKLVGSADAPLEPWLEAAGGPAAEPGKTGEVTLDLEPGRYWYFSTESGEGEGAKSDSELGMKGELTLEGDSGAEFPVAAPASILASDYHFKFDGFEAGENTIAFRNAGQQLHHALFFPLLPGKTVEDAKQAFEAEGEPSGPPPVDFEKGVGTTVINPGQTMIVHLELPAGSYVAVCFMPDKGTAGPPHAAKGMLAELKVE